MDWPSVLTAIYDWIAAEVSSEEFHRRLIYGGLQILIIAPIVSFVVTARQRARERSERLRMVPHLIWSTFPIRRSMDALVDGQDGELALAGLNMFARQYETKTEKMYDANALRFYLGHPHLLSGILKQRVADQVDYVDGLLDLFAPHFRTADAVRAQGIRSSLRDLEREVTGIREGIDALAGTTDGTTKFLAHLKATEATVEGAERRRSVIDDAAKKRMTQARELAAGYAGLPKMLDSVAASIVEMVEGIYDKKAPYTTIMDTLNKKRWFENEMARLASSERKRAGRNDNGPERDGEVGQEE
jgi:hypothetical protein